MDYATLLAALRRARGPVTVPELARRLAIEESRQPALRRQMDRLASEGAVFSQRRGRWALHSRARIVVGRYSSPRRTFGFVIPDDGDGGDVFIAERRSAGARHGDRVLARLIGSRSRGEASREGEVLSVLEARARTVAGVFHAASGGGLVTPRDERDASSVVIEGPGGESPPPDGSVVWIEITAPEDRFRPARGILLERLGLPGAPGTDLQTIRRQYDLPGEFPEGAIREADAFEEGISESARQGREDFTSGCVFTVDPADAKDHDDAVQLTRHAGPRGEVYRLGVHIADVSRYVQPGSELDAEALRRGTSVYFPGAVIPMLPAALSSGLCSLLPGVERLVQSVVIDFDPEGEALGVRFADGIIRSAASLSYEQLGGLLEGKTEPRGIEPGVVASMGSLCRALRARRLRRGSLDLELPETSVTVDPDGRPTGVVSLRHGLAHQVIEEFMLAANEAVAAWLAARLPAAIFRIHEDPEEEEIAKVEEELREMGFPLRRGGPTASARLKGILRSFAGTPELPAVAAMVLRALKLARYSHEPEAHFGLAAPIYTHFTSPIRRYPDLVVHRLLRAARDGSTGTPPSPERLEAIARDCSRLERRAEEAERAVVAWKTAVYMGERIGREYQGMVTGLRPTGYFVQLEESGIEGFVPQRSAAAGRPSREGRLSAAPRRLGERLRVRVQQVDPLRGRIQLKPVSTG